MKRDLELLRKILLCVENQNETSGFDSNELSKQLKDFSYQEILYHVELLIEAHYIEVLDYGTYTEKQYLIKRLTMSGHDYIDSIRDEKVWRKVLKGIASQTTSFTLDLIKEYAKQIILGLIQS